MTARKKSSVDQLKPTATDRRRKTRNDIFSFIDEAAGSVTKQDIAYHLKLSLPTVYQNLAELEEAGLIRAAELQKPSGGRPPVGYEAASDARYAVGVSLSAEQISAVIMDLKQNEIASAEEKVERLDEESLIGQMGDLLDRLLSEQKMVPDRMLGIGITIPGVLDETGTGLFSPTMNLTQFSTEKLRERYGCDVTLENDSSCGGMAELSALPAENRDRQLIYLLLEYGVGGAIFQDGRQWQGQHKRSAEFGHMCIVPGGRKCSCGKKGCLEAYCGAFRFSREQGITVEEFFDAIEKGNETYEQIWLDALDHLAIAVGNLHMIFDCDLILGGFLAERIKPYMEYLQARLREAGLFGGDTSYLKIGNYLHKAGMYGAAWKHIEQFKRGI